MVHHIEPFKLIYLNFIHYLSKQISHVVARHILYDHSSHQRHEDVLLSLVVDDAAFLSGTLNRCELSSAASVSDSDLKSALQEIAD